MLLQFWSVTKRLWDCRRSAPKKPSYHSELDFDLRILRDCTRSTVSCTRSTVSYEALRVMTILGTTKVYTVANQSLFIATNKVASFT